MSQKTTYYCDFSPQVPEHKAFFRLNIQGGEFPDHSPLPTDQRDACDRHRETLVNDAIRKGYKELKLVVVEKPPEKGSKGPRNTNPHGVYLCAADNCEEIFDTPQMRGKHQAAEHPELAGVTSNAT